MTKAVISYRLNFKVTRTPIVPPTYNAYLEAQDALLNALCCSMCFDYIVNVNS